MKALAPQSSEIARFAEESSGNPAPERTENVGVFRDSDTVPGTPGLLTLKEFAALSGAKRGTLGRWVTEGMPFVVGPVHPKTGRPISLISPAAANAWIAERRRKRRFGPTPTMNRRSFVYFAHEPSTGLVKIGFSSNPTRRVMELGSPCRGGHRLTLLASFPGDKPRELELHRKFAHLRTSGEWFRAEPELLDFVASLKAVAA